MGLDALVEFSNKYGSDKQLVLAGGGNTSFKTEDIMYIKGSGTALASIKADEFVAMDRKKLSDMFTKTYPENDNQREAEALKDMMDAKLPGQENKRPSVETTLHSLFPQKYVLHLHPAIVNGLTCSKNGEEKTKELFKDDIIWVEICRPGYVLAKLCFDKIQKYKAETGTQPKMLMLQNHGIFFAADCVSELDSMLNSVINTLKANIKEVPEFLPFNTANDQRLNITNIIKELYGNNYIVKFEGSELGKYFSENPNDIFKPFTPDHIVYNKAFSLFIETANETEAAVKKYNSKYGYNPKVIFVKGIGAFAVGKSEKDASTVIDLLQDSFKIAVYSKSFGGALPMTDDLIDFIINWEAEAYRSKNN